MASGYRSEHYQRVTMPVARGGGGGGGGGGVRGVRSNTPSEGQGPLMWKYGTGPGRSPRRLEAF